jgi:hypothetical protein
LVEPVEFKQEEEVIKCTKVFRLICRLITDKENKGAGLMAPALPELPNFALLI